MRDSNLLLYEKKYRCPACDNSAEITKKSMPDMQIFFECQNCKSAYPVRNGIPRFVHEHNYSDSFGYQWNIHSKTQLDSFTGLSITRNRLFGVTKWPEKMWGETILEAGSGAGRFTEILISTGAEVFSFDCSLAVEANRSNNGHAANLHIFQGDINNIPLLKRSFNRVLCLGVLQHTPEPERAFRNLAQYVKPGGELVIDVYAKRFTALLHWKYILRPLTKRVRKEVLYKIIERVVPILLPISILSRKAFGRIGSRIFPIVEYSDLGLPYELNKQWSILDTFDMYSPEYDHPQTAATVERWFKETGFGDIVAASGPNGIVGKGRCPK